MASFVRLEHALSNKSTDETFIERSSPLDYLKSLGIDLAKSPLPTICAITYKEGENPIFLSREEWDNILPEESVCTFVSYPRWGGTAGAAAATYWGLTAAQWVVVAVTVISTAASIYASRANGSLRPSAQPNQVLGENKPTYEISDQGNAIRLGQPVPIQYGRIRSYPDLAAKSYNEFNSDDEYLYVLLMLGEGQFDIEDVQIDDTDINNFTDVEFNILPPGTDPVLFPTTVATSPEVAGIELGDDFSGPFVATDKTFIANRIDFDVTFPNGLFSASGAASASVTIIGEVRPIDINDNPTGPFVEVVNEVVTETSLTPVRRTFNHFVTPGQEGRFEARLRRIGETSVSPSVSDRVDWVTLRAYSETGHPDYGERTLIEIKIRATAQLNSANIGIFNVIGTRIINVWNGATFDFVPSTSVVWAWYDLIVNDFYGIGMNPNRVDIDDLFALSQQFDELGFECSMRIENSMSAMEGLKQIAQAARCQVYQRGGQVFMVRDEEREIATAFYTPENISANTLTVQWQPASVFSADHHRLTYFDEDTWQEEVVIATAGITPGKVPEDIRIYAITNRQRAFEEGRFFAAQDRFRRKIIEFETDIEGFLPNLLDKISISHESFLIYTNGIVQDIDGDEFFLSDPPDFKGQPFGFISFKSSNGNQIGPFHCVPGNNAYKVDVTGYDAVCDPIVTQISQPEGEASTFSFGPNTSSQEAKVISVSPAGEGKVRIKAVNDDPRVYTADQATALPIGAPFDINET